MRRAAGSASPFTLRSHGSERFRDPAAHAPVRIVCANTLGYALSRAEGADAQRTFRFRHTGGLHTRLHEARRVMQITIDYAEQFRRLGDRLALEPITERALRTRVLDRLFVAAEGMGGRTARNREEAEHAVLAIFRGQGAAGDTRGSAPGSKWCAVNAIAEQPTSAAATRAAATRCSAASRTPSSSSVGSSCCWRRDSEVPA